MSARLQQLLEILALSEHSHYLTGIRRGIEKECLRINADGTLAQSSHPPGLGSALTHQNITTDFSEAQLELITPVSTDITWTLNYLEDIHRFIYSQLDGDRLWLSSMPCFIEEEGPIPIAQYGSSNIATMKTVYRKGLSLRYGSVMQTISGIHYNFSLPDEFWPFYQKLWNDEQNLQAFKNKAYFSLIRNFRRYSWLLVYLFGASPVICKSFLQGQPHTHTLTPFDENSLCAPYGTSLRMSDLGYQSQAQNELIISYNSLDEYIQILDAAMKTSYEPYEVWGVKDVGDYRQLSTCLLQIENEFYNPIRPKRVTRTGEKSLKALHERGVEYVEVRCLDVNPFLPLGIDARQIRFLDTFLLYCLLYDSPESNHEEHRDIVSNLKNVVNRGRDPTLVLRDVSHEVSMTNWAKSLLNNIQPIAEILDDSHDSSSYRESIQQLLKAMDPEQTPSASILRQMRDQKSPYFKFTINKCHEHEVYLRETALSADKMKHFQRMTEQSLIDQITLEEKDTLHFDAFLANYFNQ